MDSLASKTGGVGLVEMLDHSDRSLGKDDAALARMGKQAVLKRRFGYLSILGFSCTVLITWEATLGLFLVGLQNGGTAGVIYGYVLVWIGTTSLFAVLSELVSMAPTSGGQYHWVSMLAPTPWRKLLSYVSGWLTLCGWQAFVASTGFLQGTTIQSMILLMNPEYEPKNWHGTLLYWATIVFCLLVNAGAGWILPKLESGVLVIHILGFFGVIIPLLILGPKGNAHDIFTQFSNLGGWSSQGLSFCIGIMGNVFAFAGGDGTIHMCEEIQNAQVVVPRSIMTGVLINGTFGFAMTLCLLFRAGDLDRALAEIPQYPWMAIFKYSLNSRNAAIGLACMLFILGVASSAGGLASASRVFWAFSRDKGVPGWRRFSRVSERKALPMWSIVATTTISIVLSCINIGSPTAFNGVISVSIAGLYASYLLVACMLLYRRCTGAIRYSAEATSIVATNGHEEVTLIWGPWRIPGVLGIVNNAFACVYLIFVFFFSFWPSYATVTAATMNWSILVTGLVALLSTVYYLMWARHTYKGPVVEIVPY